MINRFIYRKLALLVLLSASLTAYAQQSSGTASTGAPTGSPHPQSTPSTGATGPGGTPPTMGSQPDTTETDVGRDPAGTSTEEDEFRRQDDFDTSPGMGETEETEGGIDRGISSERDTTAADDEGLQTDKTQTMEESTTGE